MPEDLRGHSNTKLQGREFQSLAYVICRRDIPCSLTTVVLPYFLPTTDYCFLQRLPPIFTTYRNITTKKEYFQNIQRSIKIQLFPGGQLWATWYQISLPHRNQNSWISWLGPIGTTVLLSCLLEHIVATPDLRKSLRGARKALLIFQTKCFSST